MPDYYRGGSGALAEDKPAFFKTMSWDTQLKSDFQKVKSFGKQYGCQNFGSIGTCWGTYPVVRMSEDTEVKAGISMHPSHPNIIGIAKNEWKMYPAKKIWKFISPEEGKID